MAQLFAGTSGFAYPTWKPRFYPEKLPQAKFLQHYATRLNCVEINYTFRRMPAATTLANWIAATPAGFRFAHERITHLRRLQNARSTKRKPAKQDGPSCLHGTGAVAFLAAPSPPARGSGCSLSAPYRR